jgi:hypothetical protein
MITDEGPLWRMREQQMGGREMKRVAGMLGGGKCSFFFGKRIGMGCEPWEPQQETKGK